MGCGCRKTPQVAGRWVHLYPDGGAGTGGGNPTKEPYATEWEARAAAERSGGTYRWESAARG